MRVAAGPVRYARLAGRNGKIDAKTAQGANFVVEEGRFWLGDGTSSAPLRTDVLGISSLLGKWLRATSSRVRRPNRSLRSQPLPDDRIATTKFHGQRDNLTTRSPTPGRALLDYRPFLFVDGSDVPAHPLEDVGLARVRVAKERSQAPQLGSADLAARPCLRPHGGGVGAQEAPAAGRHASVHLSAAPDTFSPSEGTCTPHDRVIRQAPPEIQPSARRRDILRR
jgi:hypothetical protein